MSQIDSLCLDWSKGPASALVPTAVLLSGLCLLRDVRSAAISLLPPFHVVLRLFSQLVKVLG